MGGQENALSLEIGDRSFVEIFSHEIIIKREPFGMEGIRRRIRWMRNLSPSLA